MIAQELRLELELKIWADYRSTEVMEVILPSSATLMGLCRWVNGRCQKMTHLKRRPEKIQNKDVMSIVGQ